MQPFIAAMSKMRQAFFDAIIRSLLRTKSLLQTILKIWISPSLIKGENVDVNGKSKASSQGKKIAREEFLEMVEKAFRPSTSRTRLAELSAGFRKQFLESMEDNPLCMLPSYNHQLPSGDERGTFLALDVGGSTFRVALIELSGRGAESGQEARILKQTTFKINNGVRQLKGVLFFDWMAERIEETLSGQTEGHDMSEAPLSMGLAWSFPIEQTSLRSGLLQGMGKGFLAAHGLLGQDLGDLIQASCSRRGLNVVLNAIVNDSSATLLSKAYSDPTTRFALILGTGVNAAIHLPVHVFAPPKFGVRPLEWHACAKHVIVNTELSMFGAGILPSTIWDDALRAAHPNPTFQPLEHFVSGGYLGEIVRLILVDGIQNAGLFNGVVPPSLKERYSLDTETISLMESDTSPTLSKATQTFTTRHPSPANSPPPTHADILALTRIASHVSSRAASLVATGVHALWRLHLSSESLSPEESTHNLVAYNGSVLENYPGFREKCQSVLDGLVEADGGKEGEVRLVYAVESSLLGAAVAGAVAGCEL